ncbi:Acetyl xylan esterase [Rhodopirellula maiorica SM1]|uniref:Acetyl xylan esterase n=1 Tax=Rhodopirellula maiorica SM1 TaxID=1265738 RepID=M5RTB4_9BACT|nr:acetylxylan esterase [Rhodopirellula maiorica]EMI22583.1 Acetyl xylan esterase [Rhodopirellula maiorica SM1]
MKHFIAFALLLCSVAAVFGSVSVSAEDVRHRPLNDLNGYFPFHPPASLEQWETRKEYVRRQILVATGLWPMPTKTPLNPVLHGKIQRDGYTVEKVYFESAPGLFVTGNLYRPTNIQGKVPGVMLAHGHHKDARLDMTPEGKLRGLIADGAERFERAGRSTYQSQCRQLALMGCVVWQWDMLGDSDSIQLSRELVHGFAKQRPEMNTTKHWGLFSPQAEAHCQNVMGLQTLNAVRGLDFLLSLPEVDSERVAVTGASGGGTQTMILAAIDERIKLSFPVVMVSTAMQGGCTCENASLLRVNTGNVEFAALAAPRPQGMNTADDWTKEMATKGFPDLQQLYALYGKKGDVFLKRGEHFPHNYNAVTRSAFYTFLNKHFKLGFQTPVIEHDFEPLPPEQLTVWNDQHPAPKAADPDFERNLLAWFTNDAEQQLSAAASTPEGLKNVILPAAEVIIGRTYANAGDVTWELDDEQDHGDYVQHTGTLLNKTHSEEVNVVWLCPKHPSGRVVIWLDDSGKTAVCSDDGSVNPAVQTLVQAGVTVLGADLFLQNGKTMKQTRVVENPREFAGYTFGYNHALFAQRTHDVLSIVRFLRHADSGPCPNPDLKSVAIAGWHHSGPIAAVAGGIAGDAIDRTAIDTKGFRFGQVLDYRDPMFLPGGAKYLDLPGLIALHAPRPLWLAGESQTPATITTAYLAASESGALVTFIGDAAQKQTAASEWLLK